MAHKHMIERGPEFGFTTQVFNLITESLPALTHDKPGCPCGCGTVGLCMDLVNALPADRRAAAIKGRINAALRAAIEKTGTERRKARGTSRLFEEDACPYETAPHAAPEPQPVDWLARARRTDEANRPETWSRLDLALTFCLLPDEQGLRHQHRAAEFMLMHVEEDGTIGFKHHDTRNYIFLLPSGRLYVPITDQPFMRGFF